MSEIIFTPEEIALKARVSKIEAATIRRIAIDIKKTFGPAPIVTDAGERPQEFDWILMGVVRQRCPRDFLDAMYAWDIATEIWANKRIDLVTRKTLERGIKRNLKAQKERRDHRVKQEKTKQGTDEYLRSIKSDDELTALQKRDSELKMVVEETRDDIDMILDRAEAEAAHAEAFKQEMPFLRDLDDMKSRSFFRRNSSIESSLANRPRLPDLVTVLTIEEQHRLERKNKLDWLTEVAVTERESQAARTPAAASSLETSTVPADQPVGGPTDTDTPAATSSDPTDASVKS